MGAGGAKGAKGAIDEKSLASQYKLTPEQIHALVIAFKSGADSKPEIDKDRFVKVIKVLRDTNPELTSFDDEVAGLVFSLCDTDHSGKVDPIEVVAALAAFSSGNSVEKAKLVFKTIDKNNDGSLNKDELKKHACKVLVFATSLVKADMKVAGKAAGLGVIGSLAATAVSAGLGAAEKQFVLDIVRDIFTLDKGTKGFLTLDEWVNGADTNNTVKAMIDPNLSANVWRTVVDPTSTTDTDAIFAEIQRHPKGFAHIFDLQYESGRFQPTGPKIVPVTPLIPVIYKLTLGFGEQTSEVEVQATSKLSELLKTAETLSKVPLANIALRKEGGFLRGDEDTLKELEVTDGMRLDIFDYTTCSGEINIKTLTGKTFKIPFTASSTVLQLKERVQDSQGIPTDQQRLMYMGKQLENEKTASEYKILPLITLHLILRLRGNT